MLSTIKDDIKPPPLPSFPIESLILFMTDKKEIIHSIDLPDPEYNDPTHIYPPIEEMSSNTKPKFINRLKHTITTKDGWFGDYDYGALW